MIYGHCSLYSIKHLHKKTALWTHINNFLDTSINEFFAYDQSESREGNSESPNEMDQNEFKLVLSKLFLCVVSFAKI